MFYFDFKAPNAPKDEKGIPIEAIPIHKTNLIKVISSFAFQGKLHRFESEPFTKPEKELSRAEMIDILDKEHLKYKDMVNSLLAENIFIAMTTKFLIHDGQRFCINEPLN